jgi:hypothetical protein
MLYFMISLIGAFIAGAIAAGKNRNALGWGALGFLLPLIGVVIALCIEPWPVAKSETA